MSLSFDQWTENIIKLMNGTSMASYESIQAWKWYAAFISAKKSTSEVTISLIGILTNSAGSSWKIISRKITKTSPDFRDTPRFRPGKRCVTPRQRSALTRLEFACTVGFSLSSWLLTSRSTMRRKSQQTMRRARQAIRTSAAMTADRQMRTLFRFSSR